MKLLQTALAGLLALLTASAAVAQTFPTVPGRSVIGRLGILGDTGPSQAIPLTTLQAQLSGTQTANKVNAGPTSGAAAFPTFRSLVGADLPAPGASSLGGVQSITCSTSNWFRTLSTSGVFGCSQPAVSDLTGFGTGVATFLATPSSANLLSAVTDETGSGALVFANTPTLVSPVLGAATATSINKVAITAPASSATLTLTDGTTLTGPAASGTAMTLGNTETVTGVKTFGSAGAVGRLKLAGTTSGTTVLDATAVASGTLTLPAETGTLVTGATTKTLTNTTFNSTGTGNTLQVSGVTVSSGQYPGEPTTGSATAGNVGEIISSTVASGSAVSLTTATPANVTSISLTAGDWDVSAIIGFNGAATTTVTVQIGSISSTSATLDTANGRVHALAYNGFTVYNSVITRNTVGPTQFSVSGATTVFLVAQSTFAVSTSSAFGIIRARRVR